MNLTQLLAILFARFKIVVFTFLAVLGLAIALSVLFPKQYTASTTVVVDAKGMDPVFGVVMPAQLTPAYIATQVDIIQSHKVGVDVVKALRLAESPVVQQQWQEDTAAQGAIEDWLADLLLKKLDVKPSPQSSVIEVSFSGTDPRFAAAIANAFAKSYQTASLELRVEPARQTAAWFDERLQQLRKNLETAQSNLNAYQREKGFTAQDERLDLEQGRLSELSAQYTVAQAQAADALSRQRQLSEYLARGASVETLPDVLANPLIQNLKSQLTLTEGRLQQIASQLGRNHPEVKRLEADIENQKVRLKAEFSSVAGSIGNAAKIAQKREAELRQALADQKTRLLKFNQGRDEQQILVKEVESAQRAYEAAAQRFQQTSLESQAIQTNISVLSKAVPPVEPSFPKLGLNVIVACVFGLFLGIAIAIVVELMDRRVRSSKELIDIEAVPFLGALGQDGERRRRWRRRRNTDGMGPRQLSLDTLGAQNNA